MKLRRKGLDLNFAKKQQWWTDITNMIDTDDETKRVLVGYIFEQVSRGKVAELDWVDGLFTNGSNIVDAQIDIDYRKRAIVNYLKEPPKDTK